MSDRLAVLALPFLACLVLTSIHTYLGIHVVMREVIFVDIALAQLAALGATIALLAGHEPAGGWTYALSLGATLLGAAFLSLTRSRARKIPHEAVIGMVYVASAALGILLADRLPHGLEHLKALLTGNIVWVTPGELLRTALLYAAIGAVHIACRRAFFEISRDAEGARSRGRNVRGWDFLFYATFGIVVTSSVRMAGVFLVFAYLIAPAVMGMLLAERVRARLAVGWVTGAGASLAGMAFAYDRPAGPAIVCALALLLATGAAFVAMREATMIGGRPRMRP
ncbi:MAG: metal ABC transporter permease [Planctomycetes bacterium]|nr:metal ABC transporter permease [Planctomycetota bacterium]